MFSGGPVTHQSSRAVPTHGALRRCTIGLRRGLCRRNTCLLECRLPGQADRNLPGVAGSAGWAPRQLEAELLVGAWGSCRQIRSPSLTRTGHTLGTVSVGCRRQESSPTNRLLIMPLFSPAQTPARRDAPFPCRPQLARILNVDSPSEDGSTGGFSCSRSIEWANGPTVRWVPPRFLLACGLACGTA